MFSHEQCECEHVTNLKCNNSVLPMCLKCEMQFKGSFCKTEK